MTHQTFGEALQVALQTRRLSQSTFALDCYYDHSYISRLVTGERKPSRDFLRRACRALQATRAEELRLYHLAGFVPPGIDLSVYERMQEATALLRQATTMLLQAERLLGAMVGAVDGEAVDLAGTGQLALEAA